MLRFGNAIREMQASQSQSEELRRASEVERFHDAEADEVEASRKSKPGDEAKEFSDLSDEEVMLLIPEEVKLMMQGVMLEEERFNVTEERLHRLTPLVMDRMLPPAGWMLRDEQAE